MLIAVCGFSGAGKTTALEHIRDSGFGRIRYAGAIVREDVVARGLQLTPETEKQVRNDLRQTHGNDVLARRTVLALADEPQVDHVLLDAICHPDEEACYRRAWGAGVITLGLFAAFEVRAARLATRADRPCTPVQLQARDDYEREELRLDEVMARVDHAIVNEKKVDALRRELDALMARWRAAGNEAPPWEP